MFDKSFIKFLLGFMAIIGLGLIGVVFFQGYGGEGEGVRSFIANLFN